MDLIVMKFGGSCLRNAEAFDKILKINELYKNDNKLVFVASALSGVTDLLLKLAHKAKDHEVHEHIIDQIRSKHVDIIEKILDMKYQILYKEFLDECLNKIEEMLHDIEEYELTPYKIDFIISFGEILSTKILAIYLNSRGIPCEYVPANLFLITDSMYNDALPLMEITEKKIQEKIIPIIEDGKIPVITGFIARNLEAHITTLGRGGSDFTTTILAYSLKPKYNSKVILWKDVDGVLTTNPKIEPSAKLIEQISYLEAKELAYFGAKLLHPRCIGPLERREIPLEIRNFDKLETKKCSKIEKIIDIPQKVKGITYIEEVSMVSAISSATVSQPGVLAKIFDLMGKNNINVSFVCQSSSEVNTTFVVDANDGEKASKLLRLNPFFSKWFDISVEKVSLIAIVGEGFNKPGILGRIFNALKNNTVLAISQTTGGINISILIPKEELNSAIKAIHGEFI
ncbi:MAG: aspartate kinase [Candidatus Helarchaeota archaeon]